MQVQLIQQQQNEQHQPGSVAGKNIVNFISPFINIMWQSHFCFKQH